MVGKTGTRWPLWDHGREAHQPLRPLLELLLKSPDWPGIPGLFNKLALAIARSELPVPGDELAKRVYRVAEPGLGGEETKGQPPGKSLMNALRGVQGLVSGFNTSKRNLLPGACGSDPRLKIGICNQSERKGHAYHMELECVTTENIRKTVSELVGKIALATPALPGTSVLVPPGGYLVAAYPRADKSSLTFEELVPQAKQRLFLVGQNLAHIAAPSDLQRQAKHKGLLFRALEKKIAIDLFIYNPDAIRALPNTYDCRKPKECLTHALEEVFGPGFFHDLKLAADVFTSWQSEARRKKYHLQVKTSANIGTFSLTFVDPEDEEHGQLVLVPVPHKSPPSTRPCLHIMSKRDGKVFQYYYDYYQQLFSGPRARALS